MYIYTLNKWEKNMDSTEKLVWLPDLKHIGNTNSVNHDQTAL